MRKRERTLRAASGGHARAKVIAKEKLAASEAKARKLRKRVRKLKARNGRRDARIEALERQTATLAREKAIDGLRWKHNATAWRKLYEAASKRLAKITDAHIKAKHELRMACRELRARA